MGIFDIFKSNYPNDKKQKKIEFTRKVRGNTNSMRETASDDMWNSWLKLEGGTFIENTDNFSLTTTDNINFIFQKKCDISVLRMFNRFLSTDLKLMEVYVDDFNPTYTLYRFRDDDRRNEFAISSVGGMGDGSWIAFKTI